MRSGSDVTGAEYRRVLEEHLFQHGRHGIATIGYWLMKMLDWAPYRPDMNSIEHIWDEIGRGLE